MIPLRRVWSIKSGIISVVALQRSCTSAFLKPSLSACAKTALYSSFVIFRLISGNSEDFPYGVY